MPASEPGETASFRCELGWLGERVLLVDYIGRLSAGDAPLRRTEDFVRSSVTPIGLGYDLSRFTGFHRAQVMAHAQTLARLAPHIAGVAVIGARPAARFAAVTVSLVSKLPLATFDDRRDAVDWLRSLVDPS